MEGTVFPLMSLKEFSKFRGQGGAGGNARGNCRLLSIRRAVVFELRRSLPKMAIAILGHRHVTKATLLNRRSSEGYTVVGIVLQV
jgi:spermidine synthase